jgi:hypothetical protein
VAIIAGYCRDEVANEGKAYCSLWDELQFMHCLSIYEKRLEQTGMFMKQ